MYFDVTHAEHVEGYRIKLSFEDGSSGIADLSSYPSETDVFRAFLDMDFFRTFRVEYGILDWGDGNIDIAPERLYELATGKTARYSDTTAHHT
jgi:hypothetical protein